MEERLSERQTVLQSPGKIVKIKKSIDEKQQDKDKEHDEMRMNLLNLIQPKQSSESLNQEETKTPELKGEKGISILSNKEWNTLVGIYKTDDNFDPLQVVDRERVRKSLLNGIPPNLRGDIWCMLCRCQREKDSHGEGLYKKLCDPLVANPQDEHRIKKDVGRTFTNYPTSLPIL